MTTTITLQTVGWPAMAIITDRYSSNPNTENTVVTRQRVERYQTIPFYCNDTRAVAFEELTSEGWQDKPVENADAPGIVADSDGTDGH